MASVEGSVKRIAISKANAQMVGIVAGAIFLTIISLMWTKSEVSQNRYEARVTKAKELSKKKLKNDIIAYASLQKSYQNFDAENPNIIGGQVNGSSDQDGSNSQIILDALPDSYDFPALTSSLEKVLSNEGVTINSVSGTDDQLNQQGNTSSSSPQPQTMPFNFSVSDGNYGAITDIINRLDLSIRPMAVDSLTISGGGNNMQMSVSAHSYYQAAKNLKITQKAVQ